jgi:hypothetical protein
MTLYATCDRCEAIQEVATPAEQVTWRCLKCALPRRSTRQAMGRPRQRPISRACVGCPVTFAPRRLEQRFCSRGCATRDSVRKYFTAESRRRGAINSAAKKRAMVPADLTDRELDVYRRGYKRGYVLGYTAKRRERAKKEAA